MIFLRLWILPLVTATLLVNAASGYSVSVITAAKKEPSAHSNKPARFHYVCPMHEDVTSKTPGICPKCKMKLVRKAVPPKPSV
jgi:heavy metal-binding protein